MKRVNKTKYAILGFLTYKPLSGYDIKKIIDNSIKHFWSENFGRLYPVLKDMEAEDLIIKEVKSNTNRPAKNIFSITNKGKEEFIEWMKVPAEFENKRHELLLKLFFGTNVSNSSLIEQVNRTKEHHESLLSIYEGIDHHIKEKHTGKDREKAYWLMTLNNGKHYSKSQINWCNETIRDLKDMEKK